MGNQHIKLSQGLLKPLTWSCNNADTRSSHPLPWREEFETSSLVQSSSQGGRWCWQSWNSDRKRHATINTVTEPSELSPTADRCACSYHHDWNLPAEAEVSAYMASGLFLATLWGLWTDGFCCCSSYLPKQEKPSLCKVAVISKETCLQAHGRSLRQCLQRRCAEHGGGGPLDVAFERQEAATDDKA